APRRKLYKPPSHGPRDDALRMVPVYSICDRKGAEWELKPRFSSEKFTKCPWRPTNHRNINADRKGNFLHQKQECRGDPLTWRDTPGASGLLFATHQTEFLGRPKKQALRKIHATKTAFP